MAGASWPPSQPYWSPVSHDTSCCTLAAFALLMRGLPAIIQAASAVSTVPNALMELSDVSS